MKSAEYREAKHAWLRSPDSYADLDKRVALLPVGVAYDKKVCYQDGKGFYWQVILRASVER